jgi:hypothetical protein
MVNNQGFPMKVPLLRSNDSSVAVRSITGHFVVPPTRQPSRSFLGQTSEKPLTSWRIIPLHATTLVSGSSPKWILPEVDHHRPSGNLSTVWLSWIAGPVEIVDLAMNSMVDLSIVFWDCSPEASYMVHFASCGMIQLRVDSVYGNWKVIWRTSENHHIS